MPLLRYSRASLLLGPLPTCWQKEVLRNASGHIAKAISMHERRRKRDCQEEL